MIYKKWQVYGSVVYDTPSARDWNLKNGLP